MSFIELTRRDSSGVTVNTDHIATFRTAIGGNQYRGSEVVAKAGEVVTEIMLAGLLPGMAYIQVTESYEEVSRLVKEGRTG